MDESVYVCELSDNSDVNIEDGWNTEYEMNEREPVDTDPVPNEIPENETFELRHDKTNKMTVRLVKIQISLGIRLRCALNG